MHACACTRKATHVLRAPANACAVCDVAMIVRRIFYDSKHQGPDTNATADDDEVVVVIVDITMKLSSLLCSLLMCCVHDRYCLYV